MSKNENNGSGHDKKYGTEDIHYMDYILHQ